MRSAMNNAWRTIVPMLQLKLGKPLPRSSKPASNGSTVSNRVLRKPEHDRNARAWMLTDSFRSHGSLFRKAVQQGHSKRGDEAFSPRYFEPLSAARTPLAAFVNSLRKSRVICRQI